MTLKEQLEDKKILFFSVQTFNLEKEIVLKLKSYGAEVDYYDERPNNNSFTKGIIRVKRSLYKKKINVYYSKILKQTKNKEYDFLFVNKGEVITKDFLKKLKEQQLNCKFIFYTWDSFKNNNNPLNILKYFDDKFTFDSEDALKYNLKFRPLFFLDSFKAETQPKRLKYDLLFLGTAHSDRYLLTNKITDWCYKNKLKTFSFFYLQGRLVYLYKSLFDKTFKKVKYKNLNFNSLTAKEIIDLYSKSKVLLDINHPSQKGLTMRTFEAIGARKKIITTNKEIKKYIFYNPNNIKIIDRDNLDLDLDFFASDYQKIDNEVYKMCTIDGWLSSIFIEKNNFYWFNNN
ncbi:MAG: hypothetical protein ACPGTO_03630 [Polaribacter sp.]